MMTSMRSLLIQLLLLAFAGAAHADDVPQRALSFLKADETFVTSAEAMLGPAVGTALVAFTCRENDVFEGFALLPGGKSKGDQRVALPKLPFGSIRCEIGVVMAANLDKDPAEEVVVSFHVLRKGVKAWEYVVLHWNGKAFTRVVALERKLEDRANGERYSKDSLGEDDVRAVLGVKKP
jgi:hypothetical protein